MNAATTACQSQKAPCGRIVDGQHVQDRDEDDGLIVDDYFYACGCRAIHHEFHDGSIMSRIVRHDGHVLVDELIAEH